MQKPLKNPELVQVILNQIKERGPDLRPSDIAAAGGSTPKNIYRDLNSLEDQGHLIRNDCGWSVPARTQSILASYGRAVQPDTAETESAVRAIRIADLEPNPNNPRKTYDPDKLDELAASLAAKEQQQNIGVRPIGGGRFQVIFGNRRLLAGRLNIERGIWPEDKTLFARVFEHETDTEALELALIENMVRADVAPFEQSQSIFEAFTARADEFGSESAAIAHLANVIGKSENAVRFNVKAARDLTPDAQAAFRDGRMTLRMALIVARLDAEQQNDIVRAMDESLFRPIRSERDLKNWLSENAPRSDAMIFDLADYEAAGGQLAPVSPDDPNGPQFLLTRGLASYMQSVAVNKLLEEKNAAANFTAAPAIIERVNEEWISHHNAPDTPRTHIAIMGADLVARIVDHLVRVADAPPPPAKGKSQPSGFTDGGTIKASDSAQTDSGQIAATISPPESHVIAKPLGPKNWRAGGVVRTRQIRKLVSADARMAMALTISTLAGCAAPLLQIRPAYPTGDQHDAENAADMPKAPDLSHLISEDLPAAQQSRALVRKLLELTDMELETLFSGFIAAACYDFPMMAGAGSTDQALGLMDYLQTQADSDGPPATTSGAICALADLEPEQMNADWLNTYERGQLIALIKELDLMTPDQILAAPAWPKKELISAILEAADDNRAENYWIPAECRFLTSDDALAAAAKQTGQAL